jgi:hypothetical protein
MANARSGGPRRPDLDYYEYKRQHEQRVRLEAAPAVKPDPVKPAAERPAPAPEIVNRPVPEMVNRVNRPVPEAAVNPASEPLDLPDEDDLDLPAEPLDLPEEKPSLFSGVKSLMKGVAHRVPEDEPEEREAHEHHGRHERPQPEIDEDEDEEGEATPGDGPQIDNPIGDALVKVKDLFLSARQKLTERRAARPQQPEDEPEEPVDAAPAPRDADSGEAAPMLSRRMRKAARAYEETEQPPILDIPAMDEREVDELVSGPGTTVHAGFAEDLPESAKPPVREPDDEDDDDDLPSARGTRLFGFFRKVRGRGAEPEAREDLEPEPEEEPSMDEDQRSNLTQRLAEEMAGAPALSRRERKALAAGKPVPAASAVPAVATPAEAPAAMSLSAPAQTAYPVDEPTQQFRPLRARPARTLAPAPVRLTDEDEEEEEEAPVRKPLKPVKEKKRRFYDDEEQEGEEEEAVKPPKPAKEKTRRLYDDEEREGEEEDAVKPPKSAKEKKRRLYDDEEQEDEDDDFKRPLKPAREKKRRIYQDEDLEDEADYGERDRYDDYDDYDEYDDYDDYDELEDEYRVSGGRRFLGFLKGLVVFILFLAVCVLVLRQLEGSRLISLGGLRGTVGQVIPIDLILPSPEPTAIPAPTAEPTAAPTEVPTMDPNMSMAPGTTMAPDTGASAVPAETPGADIAQVQATGEPDGVVSGD